MGFAVNEPEYICIRAEKIIACPCTDDFVEQASLAVVHGRCGLFCSCYVLAGHRSNRANQIRIPALMKPAIDISAPIVQLGAMA